ncbi:MAG: hypothetical protein VR68_11645 [Peptococcaceae bacterium BRH_c4a]|nr:MAG: hypothetical protein VR68_11645 [Peptococcaceae bacterium BRH_c4a]
MDRLKNIFASTFGVVRNTKNQVVKASGAVTATGYASTTGIDVADYIEGLLAIDITAVSGTTPTIDFAVETYDGAQWFNLGLTIAQKTGVSSFLVPITNFGEKIRLKHTVGGTTPSFTYGAKFIGKS